MALTTEELAARVEELESRVASLEALADTMRQAILGNVAKRDELAARRMEGHKHG